MRVTQMVSIADAFTILNALLGFSAILAAFEGDLELALGKMNEHGTLVDTIARAQHYGAMAKDALGIFPESELREALINIVDFCIDRAY